MRLLELKDQIEELIVLHGNAETNISIDDDMGTAEIAGFSFPINPGFEIEFIGAVLFSLIIAVFFLLLVTKVISLIFNRESWRGVF